ncbi:CHAT domain-containing protein [Streptomyces sp. NPDC048281]|uniref:CHAT domain-containing protein n=1 Tax=Streptomyces sp. NPDC048281 TaxID=3154715 RepID=UPI00344079AE
MAERPEAAGGSGAVRARAAELLALAGPVGADLLEEAMWLHDELEDPPADHPPADAVALRRWILSRLPPAGGAAPVTHFLRRELFGVGALDVEPGPRRRMRVWQYLGAVRMAAHAGTDRALLDSAVRAFRSCLAVAEELPVAERGRLAGDLDQVSCRLAALLGLRYNQDREILLLPDRQREQAAIRADLTEAITLTDQVEEHVRAAGGTRPLPPEWAGVRAHLLTYRWQDAPPERRANDIDEALRLLESVPPPTGDPGSALTWWGSRSLLANALIARGHRADLRRAERLLTETLDRPETQEPVIRTGILQTLATALMLIAELDRTDAGAEAAAARAYDTAYRTGLQGNLRASWDAATQHAGWLRLRGRRRDSARRYGAAFRVLPALTRLQRDRGQKERVLAQAADVSADCVRELALSRDPEDRVDALGVLESARAVLLSEALVGPGGTAAAGDDQDSVRLARLAAELDGLRRAAMVSASADALARAEATHREYVFLAERLRRRDGVTRSLPALWEDVRSAADSAALVFLVAGAGGGAALIVPAGAGAQDAPVGVDLPDLDRRSVREMLAVLAEADALRPGEKSPRTGETNSRLARRLVERLWHQAMRPVAAELRGCGRAVLLPGGLLGMLPLHAAGLCTADSVDDWWFLMEETVLSYAPSVGVLTAARQAAAAVPSLLLATEPPPSDGPGGTPDARTELDAVRNLTRVLPHVLAGREATPEKLLRSLDECDVLHFAGHAESLPDAPLESGLRCAGGRLSVRDLLARGPGRARTALLCACSTARVGTELPDEAVGLPTALLQAGFGSVVSTQWTVFDNTTGLLLQHVYDRWDAGQDLAQALTGSQRALLRGLGGPVMANPWDWGAFVHTGA